MSSWSEHKAPDGRLYYYNSITKESTWERPAELLPPTPGHQQGMNQGYGGGYASGGYGQPGFGPGPQYGYGGAPYAGGGYGYNMGYGEPAASSGPGAAIQKGKQAQGPPGANLFVFHIPNQITTRQLYDLFAPFGNVISARIMVERDTGRSRGFGFVSYDMPDSAEAAIRALDGYSVHNKRLKVSHKKENSGDQDPYAADPRQNNRGKFDHRPFADAGGMPGLSARSVPAGSLPAEFSGSPTSSNHSPTGAGGANGQGMGQAHVEGGHGADTASQRA